MIYAFAAWQALGRIPNADPNAFQTGNLDSITAVVIGGTSLFGGRGNVLGTVVGATCPRCSGWPTVSMSTGSGGVPRWSARPTPR